MGYHISFVLFLNSFSLWDEDDYKYEIFSVLSIAHAWTSFILAGKRDSRRHSTTNFSENVVVAGTNYQILEGTWLILIFRRQKPYIRII